MSMNIQDKQLYESLITYKNSLDDFAVSFNNTKISLSYMCERDNYILNIRRFNATLFKKITKDILRALHKRKIPEHMIHVMKMIVYKWTNILEGLTRVNKFLLNTFKGPNDVFSVSEFFYAKDYYIHLEEECVHMHNCIKNMIFPEKISLN
jgi:hypothetical protein